MVNEVLCVTCIDEEQVPCNVKQLGTAKIVFNDQQRPSSDNHDVSAAAATDDDDDDDAEMNTEMDYNDLPQHLKLGSLLTFSITVLQASGIPADCTDVFCQFK